MLLIVISFIGLCVFSLSDPVYIGDVIGTTKVAHNVTYENYSGKYTTLEYTYRDKEGIVFNRFIKFKSKEDFEESTTAQRIISQGKVYGETWYSISAKVILWLILIAWIIITIGTWVCYADDYSYNDPPDRYNCFYECPVNHICLLLNNSNYPQTSEFFGYGKNISSTV